MRPHTEQFKIVAMTIIIAILSALFIGLLVDAIYEAPKYEDYCDQYKVAAPIPERKIDISCPPPSEEESQCYRESGFPEFDYDEKGCAIFRECNMCNKEFEKVNNNYNRNIFFIVAPIGLVMIIFGVYYGLGFIGSGFMFGGILSVTYGTIRYFSSMSKLMRVMVIFVELIIVVWLGVKKFKNPRQE